MLILDDSFIEAWSACAKDKDPRVWSAEQQKIEAIALMMELSNDLNREVRSNAIYFGLSTVRNKDEAVVRRLIDIAMRDREPNDFGRICWGLKTDKNKAARILQEYMKQANTNPTLAKYSNSQMRSRIEWREKAIRQDDRIHGILPQDPRKILLIKSQSRRLSQSER